MPQVPLGVFKDSIENNTSESSTSLVARDLAVPWINIFPQVHQKLCRPTPVFI